MGTCVLTDAASLLEMSGLSVNLSVNFKRPLFKRVCIQTLCFACCAVIDV